MRWLFFVTPAADGAYNMALDEALMRRAGRTGEAVFRVYSWSVPTLSLGRNQRARGCYDEDASRALGVRFVRRPTGGRALLHHREVTYSATLPLAEASEARSSYDFINDVLLGGLGRLGVNAGRATETKSLAPGLRPCFDVPAEHEIALAGRKLVGSAQWRCDGALLQHGSILVRDDQSIIADLVKGGQAGAAVAPTAATLADALGREPSIEEVAQPIFESLREVTGSSPGSFVLDSDVAADLDRLRGTYDDAAWTWRR
jgi:lipoyl(octanoyl) transferase